MATQHFASFNVPANLDGMQIDDIQLRVNEISLQVVELEQNVNEIEHLFNTRRDASKRMQDLMSKFQIIFNQISQRKEASCSSQDYIGVDGLGLHDFPEVPGKPKDLNSVRKRIETKDGSGYTHVREMYGDVRFVLKNTMKHNNEKSDAHLIAKILLDKFEEKWLLLLPKVMKEEERRGKEQDLTQESYHAQLVKDVRRELYKVELWLIQLREYVLQRIRRMSILEKTELVRALTKLSIDDLIKALHIVAEGNPDFQVNVEVVDLNINAQSEYTLRRLKHFIVETLKTQLKSDGGDKKEITLVNASKPQAAEYFIEVQCNQILEP